METEPSVNGVQVDSWSTGTQNTRNRHKTPPANDILAHDTEACEVTWALPQEGHARPPRGGGETSVKSPLKYAQDKTY